MDPLTKDGNPINKDGNQAPKTTTTRDEKREREQKPLLRGLVFSTAFLLSPGLRCTKNGAPGSGAV